MHIIYHYITDCIRIGTHMSPFFSPSMAQNDQPSKTNGFLLEATKFVGP